MTDRVKVTTSLENSAFSKVQFYNNLIAKPLLIEIQATYLQGRGFISTLCKLAQVTYCI